MGEMTFLAMNCKLNEESSRQMLPDPHVATLWCLIFHQRNYFIPLKCVPYYIRFARVYLLPVYHVQLQFIVIVFAHFGAESLIKTNTIWTQC